MSNHDPRSAQELLAQLDALKKRQAVFEQEIKTLQGQIDLFKASEDTNLEAPEAPKESAEQTPSSDTATPIPDSNPEVKPEEIKLPESPEVKPHPTAPVADANPTSEQEKSTPKEPKTSGGLEAFIGGNIFNKIGIIITIIGVAIGAKYSIDHDLISAKARVLVGYAIGLGLLFFAYSLKPKYLSFSAVLLGGAMAILYFLTYLAFSSYDMIPQAAAFALMVVFTAFTVFAALQYNLQVIALLGLIGAFGVPFLLSNGSGKAEILFSYIALVDIGILIIAFRRNWRPLLTVSFILTWLVFSGWHIMESDRLWLELGFSTLFFALFYVAFVVNALNRKVPFNRKDITPILINSLVYFSLGYLLLEWNDHEDWLGLFTVWNAILHFTMGLFLRKRAQLEKNAFYLVIGLVLVFLTAAIPVQLEGRWITVLWIGEATVLFWLGRTKNIRFYELMSYPILVLSMVSLWMDWGYAYEVSEGSFGYRAFPTLLNVHFLTTMIFVTGLGIIAYVNDRFKLNVEKEFSWANSWGIVVTGAFFLALFMGLLLELNFFFDRWRIDTGIEIVTNLEMRQFKEIMYNLSLPMYKTLWELNFTFVFVGLIFLLNKFLLKRDLLRKALFWVYCLSGLIFLLLGLYEVSELRQLKLHPPEVVYFNYENIPLSFRYVCLAFFGTTILACRSLLRTKSVKQMLFGFDVILLHAAILWVLSSELLHWLDIAGYANNYKLGLSILWGSYALMVIGIGIWKRSSFLRIGAMGLFALTLLKLFFYDIAHLDTLSKTVVFIALGLLLLIASYLYNRFKTRMEDEKTD